MNESQATLVMIGLFALRCIVPLVLIIVLGHAMNRLLDRWAAADATRQEDPAATPDPSPALPPSVTGGLRLPLPSLSLPCWLLGNCDQAKCVNCPAYQQRGIPCWQARLMVEGKLPDTCPGCPRYLGSAHAA